MPRGVVRVLVWASVGLAVVGSAVAYVRSAILRARIARAALNETLPVNSAWWRARAKAKGDLLYVAIGDSAAQGIGASEPGRGYVGILADHIDRRGGLSVRTVNLSVSGARVAQTVEYQLPRLAKLKPDVVTVCVGANNIGEWDAAAFERALATVFDALPCHAIVADLPCFYLPHNERKVAEANSIVRRLAAQRGLAVAPLHAVTRRAGLRGIATMFAGDLFHPNDRGYEMWASAFASLVSARVNAVLRARADARAASSPPRSPSQPVPPDSSTTGSVSTTPPDAPRDVGGAA